MTEIVIGSGMVGAAVGWIVAQSFYERKLKTTVESLTQKRTANGRFAPSV